MDPSFRKQKNSSLNIKSTITLTFVTGVLLIISYQMKLDLRETYSSCVISSKANEVDDIFSIESFIPNKLPLLTMFTTFVKAKEREIIQENVLHNWRLVMQNTTLVLFETPGTEPLSQVASSLGWLVLPLPRMDRYGVPFIVEMFQKTFDVSNSTYYGYCNGDILFSDDFLSNIRALEENKLRKSVLLSGQRIDKFVDPRQQNFTSAYVADTAKKGKLHIVAGIDYFVIAKDGHFLDKVPDLVLGTPAWDNIFVDIAVKNNITTIDGTQTLTALHQSYNGRYNTGHKVKVREGKNVNLKFVQKGHCGTVACLKHGTMSDSNGIVIHPKGKL